MLLDREIAIIHRRHLLDLLINEPRLTPPLSVEPLTFHSPAPVLPLKSFSTLLNFNPSVVPEYPEAKTTGSLALLTPSVEERTPSHSKGFGPIGSRSLEALGSSSQPAYGDHGWHPHALRQNLSNTFKFSNTVSFFSIPPPLLGPPLRTTSPSSKYTTEEMDINKALDAVIPILNGTKHLRERLIYKILRLFGARRRMSAALIITGRLVEHAITKGNPLNNYVAHFLAFFLGYLSCHHGERIAIEGREVLIPSPKEIRIALVSVFQETWESNVSCRFISTFKNDW